MSDCDRQLVILCVVVMFSRYGECSITTDVLWKNCVTPICGRRQLNINCDKSSKILINNVTSGLGVAFDERSYSNLRRSCMGRSSCDPGTIGFCRQHHPASGFNVSYTCIPDMNVDKDCLADMKAVYNKSGFITNPNYPSDTDSRKCLWRIHAPKGHYVHIFLHEILPSDVKRCAGLTFNSTNTCQHAQPVRSTCDDKTLETTITSCGTTEIMMDTNSSHALRFWLSYYVIPEASLLFYDSMYDVGITCDVHRNFQKRTWRPPVYTNSTDNGTFITNVTVAATRDTGDESDDYAGLYIGVMVGVVMLLIILITIVVLFRRRSSSKKASIPKSDSNSQTNCSDIQKRPLPDTREHSVDDRDMEPILQQGYSVVADELPRVNPLLGPSSPTYAEIEEYSETGQKPVRRIVTKRSIESSQRELPAKPNDDPANSIYFEIDDAEKDKSTEKSNIYTKNKKTVTGRTLPECAFKKKESNASNIYAECADVSEKERTYIDMSSKQYEDCEYVPHSKNSKDRVNQTKRSLQGQGPSKYAVPSYARQEPHEVKKTGSDVSKALLKSKKESVTSESDSDDDICMVENELYEPFESAKV